jgi:hypothetical protein
MEKKRAQKSTQVKAPPLKQDFPPLQLGGDLTWKTLFNGGNKYPAVPLAPDMEQYNWATLLNIFDQTMAFRHQALIGLFGPLVGVIDDLLPANIIDGTIFVPSGGKDAAKLGSLAKTAPPWWFKMAVMGAPVVLVVSKLDHDGYASWVKDRIVENAKKRESDKSIPIVDLRVASYFGFGIGCGRHASSKLILDSGKKCWMIDDRPTDVSYEFQKITDVGELMQMTEACSVVAKEQNVYVLNSPVFTNLRVCTFWQSPNVAVPFFSNGFILCKEDIALADVLNRLLSLGKNQDAHTIAAQLTVKADTNKQVGNYDNTAFKGIASQSAFELASANNCVVDISGEPLTPLCFQKKYKFESTLDMIKVIDAALHALLQDIITKYPPKESIDPRKVSGITPSVDPVAALFHAKVINWFLI